MKRRKDRVENRKRMKRAFNLGSEYQSAPLIGIIVIFLFIITYGGSI